MASLKTRIAGLELKNPTILASGILGQTGESLLRVVNEGGAGAVTTKSIGLEGRPGNGNPCVAEVEYGLLNAMGLPNPGIDEFGKELKLVLKGKVPVIGSIFAGEPRDFSKLAVKMEKFGAHAIELNLSCPHAEKYGLEVGADPTSVEEIVAGVKSSVKVPVLAKLSPMVPDIGYLAEVVEDAGGDGIVAINTIRAMKIDTELRMPVLKNKVGGLSGPSLKPVGVRCVYEISSRVKIPVIGAGGICTGQDALEYIMAGASAVQIGSGVRLRGMDVFKKVCQELEDYMNRRGYRSLSEFVGIARGK
jgi:dihydroorotate dehydrogenase (NAD+) catalytic subunit